MGDTREQTIDRLPMDLAPTPVLKVEPPRNTPGPALLRTVQMPTQQTRFLTSIQPSSNVAPNSTLAKQGGGVQRLESGQNAILNRITTVSQVQTNTSSGYHLPRGAAAVANIAVPRQGASLATPIIRGTTSTLQTISVATAANQTGFVRTAGAVSGRPGSWIGSQSVRHTNAQHRMPGGSARAAAGTTVRPVLLQAAPPLKQVQLGEKKMVGGKGSGSGGMVRGGASRVGVGVAPALRPVAATAVLVSTATPTGHPPRPVSVLTSAVRVSAAPPVSKVFCQQSSEPVYIPVQPSSHKPQQGGNLVSLASSLYSLPANSFYDGSSSFRTFTTTQVTSTAIPQTRPVTSHVQGLVATTQPVRINPVMVVDPYVPTDNASSLLTSEPSTTVSQPATSVKQNASPRPSILRKRDTDGVPGKASRNLQPLLGALTVSTPSSPPSPPKRPESRGNCGPSSGGSTTISATSSPGLGSDSPPPPNLTPATLSSAAAAAAASVARQEPDDDRPPEMSPRKKPRKQQLERVNRWRPGLGSVKIDGMSPRKKPRKQQLSGNHQIHETKFSDEEIEFIPSERVKKTSKEELAKATAVTVLKRPSMSLLRSYRPTWKARHHHFVRHADVKPREEKRPSLADIAGQRHITQRINGWKVYHLEEQMTDISNFEMDVFERLTSMLKVLEKKTGKDGDINRVNELIKGNIQRSKVISDQLQEAKCQVMKFFDHKGQVTEILNRFSSRRSGKKRERV